LSQAHSGGAHIPYAVKVHILAGPTEVLATNTGIADSGADSFDDQIPFKLRNGCNDSEEGLPERRTCLNVLLIADEPDAQTAELFQSAKQVLG
jgi:hypothetical protein